MTAPGTTGRLLLDPAARDLLAAVESDPAAPVAVGVVAPAGHGKTALLTRIGEACRRAGLPCRERPEGVADGMLLVDDAQHLDEPALREIRDAALRPGARVVLACRPWPRSAGLDAVLSALGRDRPLLTLPPFDLDRTAALIAAHGGDAEPATVREWHAATGGVPGFLAAAAGAAPPGSWARADLPAATFAAFRGEFGGLGLDAQRLLIAVDTGVRWPLDVLSAVLERGHDPVRAVETARAAGLLDPAGRLLPVARRALREVVPADRRVEVYHRMVAIWLRRRGPVRPLAQALLDTGMVGADVGTVLHAAAREIAREEPATAARFCAGALAAGREFAKIAPDWAIACAHAGDLDRALALADRMISGEGGADPQVRVAGAQVAAAAWAHRGQLDRSAELYRWSADPAARPLATFGLLGVGRVAEADELRSAAGDGLPPTSRDGAFALLADGARESVSGTATGALSHLARAATLLEPAGRDALLPDSPAAVAALVGLHSGDLAVAESLLERALAVGMGGSLLAVRHRLLLAWIAMARGEFAAARDRLAEATRGRSTVELRDWFFAVGLEVGLARRTSDPVSLRRVWTQASEAVLRHPVDLFSLLPLGEFATAAARLGDAARLAPHLHSARALLRELGDPPLWSTPLRWSCLHAAVIAERPDDLAEHLAALEAAAGHCGYCAAIHVAARRWSELTAGTVDAEAVESAARGLHDLGLWWDGAQLAGQAAVRTSDRSDMVALLNRARALRGSESRGDPPPADGATPAETEQPSSLLSERERQVAALVLDGLTYKQIGDRLYISAKTVEHHVARMRRRLGATSRADLLTTLSRHTRGSG